MHQAYPILPSKWNVAGINFGYRAAVKCFFHDLNDYHLNEVFIRFPNIFHGLYYGNFWQCSIIWRLYSFVIILVMSTGTGDSVFNYKMAYTESLGCNKIAKLTEQTNRIG